MKPTPTFLILLALATPLVAQDRFRADLDGGQEVPPVTTDAGGWGTLTLNADDSVTYDVRVWGLTATAAHIHVGAPGVSGGVIVPLSGGPTEWSGTSLPLSATDRALLLAGDTYFNVHTAANPGGEIRGQITARPLRYSALLNGDQENPPVVTAATGTGTFTVNADNTITYDVTTTGLTATAAHIHIGDIGVNGGVLFPLSGGPTSWSGTTTAMTETDFTLLQNEGLYVNVHTAANPGGEIRGQIFVTGESYGFGCEGGTSKTATLSTDGPPIAGETITVNVDGGQPASTGILAVSLGPNNGSFLSCQLLISTPTVQQINFPLGALGNASSPVAIPALASNLDVYLQFWDQDNTGAWYNTNGYLLPIRVL